MCRQWISNPVGRSVGPVPERLELLPVSRAATRVCLKGSRVNVSIETTNLYRDQRTHSNTPVSLLVGMDIFRFIYFVPLQIEREKAKGVQGCAGVEW